MATNTPEYMRAYRARKKEEFRAGKVNPPHGKVNTYVLYGCRCAECGAAYAQYSEEHRADQAELYRRHTKPYRDQIPPEKASNYRQPWDDASIALAVAQAPDGRYVYSVAEAAKMLGRTIQAVAWQRHLHRNKPGKPNPPRPRA